MNSNQTTEQAAFQGDLEFCFRKLLAWDQVGISAAALAERVQSDESWTESTVAEVADQLGFDTESLQFDPHAGGFPEDRLICRTREGGYLAVLEGRESTKVWVAAPKMGLEPVELDLAEALDQVTGEALVLRLRPVLVSAQGEDGQRARSGRYGHWFWGPVTRARWLYVQVGLAALLVNVFALTGSIFSMIVYDRVIPNNAMDTLTALMMGAGIIFISDFIIRTARGYFLDLASSKADAAIADSLFEQVLDAQMRSRRGSAGATASLLREFESIRDFLTSATLTTFIDIPFMFLFIFVIWSIGGPMVWVPAVAIPIMILSGVVVQPQLKKLVKQSQEDGHHKQAILVETLNGLETIKSLGAGGLMRRRWQEAVTHQSHVGLKSRFLAQFATNVANTSQQTVQIGVIAVGAYLIQNGQLGQGAIIACTILAGRAIAPIAQITQLLTRMNQTVESYNALNRLMLQEREHEQGVTFLERSSFRGEIEFRNVTFTYPGGSRPTLNDVSFKVAPGEKVALVGRVGSGKTTISKLILGLYRPDSGAVLIDGIDVRQIDPADLRRAMGVVLQDVWLMSGTIKQNIALGGLRPSDSAILRAAEIAGVEDFVKEMPEGYNLKLGERGEGLSGGQRQAVAIARALVNQPNILLFDEATSAMDAGAENLLLKRLGENLKGHTFMAITHKNSLLQLVDRIIVLEQGKVAAQGSPQQLLRGAVPATQAA